MCGWVWEGGGLKWGMGLQKANLYDLVGRKNPNVSMLTWGAVKYLISVLVGILLKLALFLKTALKISLFLFHVQTIKQHCHLSLLTLNSNHLPKEFIFRSRTAWNK